MAKNKSWYYLQKQKYIPNIKTLFYINIWFSEQWIKSNTRKLRFIYILYFWQRILIAFMKVLNIISIFLFDKCAYKLGVVTW